MGKGPRRDWRPQSGAQRTLMPTWYSRTFFRARTCIWLDTWGRPAPSQRGKHRL